MIFTFYGKQNNNLTVEGHALEVDVAMSPNLAREGVVCQRVQGYS